MFCWHALDKAYNTSGKLFDASWSCLGSHCFVVSLFAWSTLAWGRMPLFQINVSLLSGAHLSPKFLSLSKLTSIACWRLVSCNAYCNQRIFTLEWRKQTTKKKKNKQTTPQLCHVLCKRTVFSSSCSPGGWCIVCLWSQASQGFLWFDCIWKL